MLDFRPENLKITQAKVWLRMHGLPLEYWESTIVFAFAYGIYNHLLFNELTRKINLGIFACVQIDLNMLDTLYDRILVE